MEDSNQKLVVLPNGLRLLYEHLPNYKSFILSISVFAGSRQDPNKKEGLAHFVEHQLFRRNENYTNTQIAKEFERTGTLYNAFTEHEITVFYLKSLNENFTKVYTLLSDFFVKPVFNEKDFEKEKKIILEEIKSYYDDPEELIFDLGNEIIYPKHSLGRLITGTEKTLENITLQDIKQFFNQYYTSTNILISFIGNIPFEQFSELSSKIFSDFPSAAIPKKIEKLPNCTPKTKILKKSIEQSHILMLKRIDSIEPDLILKLKLLSYFLGESPSSMIYNQLREKSALVYNSFTNLEQYIDTNVLQIYFATDKNKLDKSFEIIDEIFNKIQNRKISKDLFNISKNAMVAQHIYKIELPFEKMMNTLRSIQLNEKYPLNDNFISKLKLINFEEFLEFSKAIISENSWSKVEILQR